MKLPIDVCQGFPIQFRWQQTVTTPVGTHVVDHEGALPSTVEQAVLDLVAMCKSLEEERRKLAAFKAWVHSYLDSHGVPTDPGGTHSAEGCRIGDRMDLVFGELESLRDKFGCDKEDQRQASQPAPNPPTNQPRKGRR